MNNKYVYREKDVLVNTDKGIEPREYVDNFDNILKVENNVEILENKMNIYRHTINRKKISRKQGIICGTFVGVCTIILSLLALPDAWLALNLFGYVSFGGMIITLIVANKEDIRKKTIKHFENKLSVCGYELEQEEKTLNELKQKSKKIEVPKSDEIIPVSTSYQIENLKNKLYIIEKFKVAPNLFIDEYNNGTIEDVLGDLGCTDMIEGTELVKYLIDEYKKQQIEKENVKSKTKSKNKR